MDVEPRGAGWRGALLLGSAAALIALANALHAWLVPALHGGQPEALYVAGACSHLPLRPVADLRACIEATDPRMTYGLPWHVLSVYAAKLGGERWASQVALVGGTFWWALLGTGRLGEHLARENGLARPLRPALAGMLLFAACPLVPALARQPQLDLLQAGAAAWGLLWLARSDGLRRLGYAASVGLLLAFSIWVKPTIAFFLAPGAAVAWWLANADLRARAAALPGAVVVAVGFGLGVLGYRLDADAWADSRMTGSSVRGDPLEFPYLGIYSDLPDAALRNLWYFARMLVNYQAGLLLGVLSLVAVAAVLRHGRRHGAGRVGSWLVVAAFAGGYVFHTWLAYKKYYYTVPALPGLMALTAVWLFDSARGAWGPRLRLVTAVACALMVGRQQLALPGPDDLLPSYAAWAVGFNHPRAFTPEPHRIEYDLERDVPILLALAQERYDAGLALEVALLPQGTKMELLGNRPDVHGFRHAWMYELHRRRVGLIEVIPEKAYNMTPTVQAFFVYPVRGTAPRPPTPTEIGRRCEVARGRKSAEPTEKGARGECGKVEQWWRTLYLRMGLATSGPHTERGPRGLVVVAPLEGTATGLQPETAAAAEELRATMGPVFPR